MTWRFQQIKPQKARGKLLESMWTDPQWVAEVKEDGDRRIAQFCGTHVRFTGTRESVDGTGFVEKTDNLPQLQMGSPLGNLRMKNPGALDGTVLDGEIIAPHADKLPGGKSKYVTAIMGSSPGEAIRKQEENGWLHYVVFDCLWHLGVDIRHRPLTERRLHMHEVLDKWRCGYVGAMDQVSGKRKQDFYDRVVARGGEGVVLKRLDHTYGDERLWVKVKKTLTADVVAIGFKPGKRKYAGMAGAIEFGQNVRPGSKGYVLKPLGTCRGFADSLMQAMTERPQDYLGRVFRIKHFGREPTGAFRSPQFDSWRDDKGPMDCVYDPEET